MKRVHSKDMTAIRAGAVARLRVLAADARAAVSTPDKAAIYAAKEAEAVRFMNPSEALRFPAGFPYLAEESAALGIGPEEMAAVYLARAGRTATELPAIEGREAAAKAAISAARTPAEVEAVLLSWPAG